jgi:phage replication initiation protein
VQEKEQAKNLILYDWLSFTSKKHTPLQLIKAMGFPDDIPWQDIKGAKGYRDRMYFNCISIHYNGRDDMGVWVEMSGQGCRAFETLSTLQNCWQDIFWFIFKEGCNVTRLDIAYDDHEGILDLGVIKQDTESGEYISKATYWEVVNSSKGLTVQIGSPQSPVLIRMYDKARERNCELGMHWVRVEIQLRDDRAKKFLGLDFDYSIGDAFCGVLLNYLRYVEPDPLDSNRWRWPLKDYWGNFLLGASKISIYEKPGLDYNLERCHNYVINQAGNALDAYIQCVGIEGLKRSLKERTTKPNPKYQQMIEDAKRFNI